jgi:hypothetical protein
MSTTAKDRSPGQVLCTSSGTPQGSWSATTTAATSATTPSWPASSNAWPTSTGTSTTPTRPARRPRRGPGRPATPCARPQPRSGPPATPAAPAWAPSCWPACATATTRPSRPGSPLTCPAGGTKAATRASSWPDGSNARPTRSGYSPAASTCPPRITGPKTRSAATSSPRRSAAAGGPWPPCNATAGSAPTSPAPATTTGAPSTPSATPSPQPAGCHQHQHDQLVGTPDWLLIADSLTLASRFIDSHLRAVILAALLTAYIILIVVQAVVFCVARAADENPPNNIRKPGRVLPSTVVMLISAAGLAAIGGVLFPGLWPQLNKDTWISHYTLLSSEAVLFVAIITIISSGIVYGSPRASTHVPALPEPVEPDKVTWDFQRHTPGNRASSDLLDKTADILIRLGTRVIDSICVTSVILARVVVNAVGTVSYVILRSIVHVANKLLKLIILAMRRVLAAVKLIAWMAYKSVLLSVQWIVLMLFLTGLPVGCIMVGAWLITASADQTRRYLTDGSITALRDCVALGIAAIILLVAAWIILATQTPRESVTSSMRTAGDVLPYALLFSLLGCWALEFISWALGFLGFREFSRIHPGWITWTLTAVVLCAMPVALRRRRQVPGTNPNYARIQRARYIQPPSITVGNRRSWWLSIAVVSAVCGASLIVLSPWPVRISYKPPAVSELTYSQLKAGDCLTGSGLHLNVRGDRPRFYAVVPCNETHEAEVFGFGNWPQNLRFPGANVVYRQAVVLCGHEFQKRFHSPAAKLVFTITAEVPSPATWKTGDRTLTCIAYRPTHRQPEGTALHTSI